MPLADPHILALATAVPPYRLAQADIMRHARDLFDGDVADLERLLPVYENAAIETRYSCMPLEWYLYPHDFAEHNRLYVKNAVALLKQAAGEALEQAELTPSDIDVIVTVSTTGIATPSLDALLMEQLPFRRDTQRLPVFGLGCAGGVLGLGRAAAISRGMPGARILLLVVELCALTFRRSDASKSNVIATALFGDGAGAVVLGVEGDGAKITDWGEHTWPASLDVMGWRVVDDGFGVLFSRDIPALVRREMRLAARAYLGRQALSLDDIDGFICHPGGAKVVEAMEDAYGLSNGALAHSRAVLRDYGNMSAATIMFVLDRALASQSGRHHLMSSLGPGFTAAFATLERA